MTRVDLHADWGERKRRAAVVKAWREQYGPWCPGYLVAAHPSEDLTADHIGPVGAGGDPRGQLTVLCRACNSRKRDGRRRGRRGRRRGRGRLPTVTSTETQTATAWTCPVLGERCPLTSPHSRHW